MLNAQASASLLTVSPPDSFLPRPEFINSSHASSSFALFAIAGSSLVRLSSFAPEVVSALKIMFNKRNLLRSVRREEKLGLLEFSLLGKPWVHKHAIESERLFIDILAVIFTYGYRFLSTIDYGRESDDRVSIAFSKPDTPGLDQAGGVHTVCLPFALSFPSSTLLRVINPPLSNSPAILQAARSGWPRGVVSERKIGEQSYEFRLKGYRWFQEDTFSADSLNHIFSLLKALDRHGFTLLTSLSLNGNHSRVKDMWIFLGPPEDIPFDLTAQRSLNDLRRSMSPSQKPMSPVSIVPGNHSFSGDALHRRSGSFPGSVPGSSSTSAHGRAASEPNPPSDTRLHTPPDVVLHKTSMQKYTGLAPPIQSPLSRSSEEEFPLRRHDLSPIMSEEGSGFGIDSANVTGVGTANMAGVGSMSQQCLYEPQATQTTTLSAQNYAPMLPDNGASRQSTRGCVKTGDLYYETDPYRLVPTPPNDSQHSPRHHAHSSSPESASSVDVSARMTPNDSDEFRDRAVTVRSDSTPFIMNSSVFRDSAISSGSNQSMEIPIAWTGGAVGKKGRITSEFYDPSGRRIPSPDTEDGYTGGESEGGSERVSQGSSFRMSTMSRLPGHWPSPIDERPEDQGGLGLPEDASPRIATAAGHPERKDVNAERVASPTAPSSPEATRQSEVAMYGMVSMQSRKTPPPQTNRSSAGQSSNAKTDGWVLVNVSEDPNASSSSLAKGDRRKSKSPPPHSSLSPIAKAIAAEDATSPEPKPALRRLIPKALSRSRSNPNRDNRARTKKSRRPSFTEKLLKKGN